MTIDNEPTLRAAVTAALELAKHKPTAKNRATLRRAQKELEEYLQQQAAPESAELTFGGIMDVVDYLDAQGFKISKSTAYDHWRKEGKISARPDGGFTLSAVLDYAHTHLSRKDGRPAGPVNYAEEKQRAEVRRITSDAEMRELKLRERIGELIPRSQVEVELSERATNLKNYFDAVARSAAGRIIKIVGGDPQKSQELISYLLGINRKAFDNYSREINLDDQEGDEV